MIRNSGSVKIRYFFVFTPSPTPSLHQSRGRLYWQTHYAHESWLMDISQGWAGWKAFAFTGL